MGDQTFLKGAQKIVSIGASGSAGTGVTSSASTNTKGTYTAISASTPCACDSFIVQLTNYNADQHDFLCDIAVGAGGSEQIIAANLYCGSTAETPTYEYPIDMQIPSGTRVAAAVACSAGSKTIQVVILLVVKHPDGSTTFQKLTTMGAATGTSGGTSIDPGTSVNTKGAYTQIVASTAESYSAILVAVGNQLQQARVQSKWLVDIAIISDILIPDIVVTCGVNRSVMPGTHLYRVEVPLGSQLRARASSDNTTATKRLIDIILYGLS